MLESIAHSIQQFILDVGYPGLFVLIVLESTLVPIPSMLVMPFAGALAAAGHFSLPVVLLVNTSAAMVGSTLSYLLGVYGGLPLLERYGKYFLVKHEDIVKTHDFFEKNGVWAIFVARFLPVVRHVISVPAGIARMRYPIFVVLSGLGATAWGGGLIVAGYFLGSRWESVANSAKRIDLVVAGLIVLTVVYLVFRFISKRRHERAAVPSNER